MARIDTIKNRPVLNPQHDVGAFGVSLNFSIPDNAAASGDRITLMQMERDGVIFSGQFAVAATLGASCTVQLQHSTADDATHTNLTGATTAGGADREQLTRAIRFSKGDLISLLVGGADVTEPAALELDLLVAHDPVINAKA